jgi:hypothetical protein
MYDYKQAFTEPQLILLDKYGISLEGDNLIDRDYVGILCHAIEKIPFELIKYCKCNKIEIKHDMGIPWPDTVPNKGYAKSKEKLIGLNANLFDTKYNFAIQENFSRVEFILFHELGHNIDESIGELYNQGIEMSYSKDWLDMSGWYREEGKWMYKPFAEFYREYSQNSPLEQFADDCSLILGEAYSLVPNDQLVFISTFLQVLLKNNNQ